MIHVTHPQAQWRRWPAGQLDPAPPKGAAVLDHCQYCPTVCLYLLYCLFLRLTLPANQVRRLAKNFWPCWPILDPLTSFLGHLAQLNPNLGQLCFNFAPTWLQVGPTCSNLVPTWLQLGLQHGPTWVQNRAKMGYWGKFS